MAGCEKKSLLREGATGRGGPGVGQGRSCLRDIAHQDRGVRAAWEGQRAGPMSKAVGRQGVAA